MPRKYVIYVADIIQEICDLFQMDWNDACDEVEFCKYEYSSEEWGTNEVEEMLKEDPDNKAFLALESLMKKKKQKTVLIIND